MANEGALGQLFSKAYIDKGKPVSESKRFRSRFSANLKTFPFSESNASAEIYRETGVAIGSGAGTHGGRVYAFDAFIRSAEMRDLLDAITIIFQCLHGSGVDASRKRYIVDIERIFREENLSYKLDNAGGVHFFVDEEFERSRSATVIGLTDQKYPAALQAYQDAHRALLATDLLGAVRRSFDSVENVFKLQYNESRLGSSEIKRKLKPVLSGKYTGRELDAANRMAESFAEWTNAAHSFRHAPAEADASPPAQDISILMVSGASGYLRWLLSLSS